MILELSRLFLPSFTQWVALFALFVLLQVMKNWKHSCRSSMISMRSYPPQYSRSSTPLDPSPSLFLFFLVLPPPFLAFSSFFSPSFSFGPFFLFFLSSLTHHFFSLLSSPTFSTLCVRVCVCIFVCICVRIWQFHVCRPMITSSM